MSDLDTIAKAAISVVTDPNWTQRTYLTSVNVDRWIRLQQAIQNWEAKQHHEYPAQLRQVWSAEIELAEGLVAEARENPERTYDPNYRIVLDPEDFIDLCRGRYHREPEDV